MQGGSQVVRSDQKKLDKIKRMREAPTTGKDILMDQERADIIKYAEVLGMDSETLVERLLIQVRELMDQPVAAMRMQAEQEGCTP
jgi:hypothetical protein